MVRIMTMETVLQVNQLGVTYQSGSRAICAVQNLQFSVNQGETVGIVGESGSGKSTTALTLMGLLNPYTTRLQGEISIDGQTFMADQIPRAIRGKQISMVFQNPLNSLNPFLRLGYQIIEPGQYHFNWTYHQARKQAITMLERMGIHDPQGILTYYPHQLSGGMRQRAMIAMAGITSPKLLIADEPTTALDTITQAKVLFLLAQLIQEQKLSLLLITHNLGIVSGLCQRLLVMKDGILVEEGYTKDVLKKPRHPYTQKLLSVVPRIDVYEPWRDPRDWKQSNQKVLEVFNLDVSYSSMGNQRRKVIDNVSFTLYQGETLGLVGESGSGKSTIAKTLMGFLPWDRGEIRLLGQPVLSFQTTFFKQQVWPNVQMVFQDALSSLNPRMTIGENIAEPLRWLRNLKRHQALDRASSLLEMVELPPEWIHRYPHELSGGQCQRVCIARALAIEPKILICDEPVSALDVSVQKNILNLLHRLREQLNLSILFIAHDLAVVRNFVDRILIIHRGQLVEEVLPQSLDPYQIRHKYTQALLQAVPKVNPDESWLRGLDHLIFKEIP